MSPCNELHSSARTSAPPPLFELSVPGPGRMAAGLKKTVSTFDFIVIRVTFFFTFSLSHFLEVSVFAAIPGGKVTGGGRRRKESEEQEEKKKKLLSAPVFPPSIQCFSATVLRLTGAL